MEIIVHIKNKTILIVSSFILIFLSIIFLFKDSYKDISYEKFLFIKSNINHVFIKKEIVYINTSNDDLFKIKLRKLSKDDIEGILSLVEKRSSFPIYLLVFIILFAFIIIFVYLRKQLFIKIPHYYGKLKYKKLDNSYLKSSDRSASEYLIKSNVRFDDVIGIDDIKLEINEVINFLNNPKKYIEFGVHLPKGILFVGEPGVGKTLIAKSISSECNVPFYYCSGASLVHMYVGVGAKRVSDLFYEAKKNSPSIIFIDELDSIGKSRDSTNSEERSSTLNQLLVEIDGFIDSSNVLIIGATNSINVIDKALLRPGRFDKKIFISKPNQVERVEILKNYLSNIKHDSNIDIEKISNLTSGLTGSSLKTLVNESGLVAIKNGLKEVSEEILIDNIKSVIDGKKRNYDKSLLELEIDSIYKASKALLLYKDNLKFDKISIFEDKISINDNSLISSKEVLETILKSKLIGNIALIEFFNTTYSINEEDNIEVSLLIDKMFYRYNMYNNLYPTDSDKKDVISKLEEYLKLFIKDNRKVIEILSKELLTKKIIYYSEIKIYL